MKKINDLISTYGLNEKQARVVVSNSKELIVPAGAGSGKTKTLVTKVLELLKHGNDLDNFLVLTFTKKAASEMKDRIKKELINNNLSSIANKIDSANISTFDAFAYNFVKQNASVIGLDSNIELLDQGIFNNIKIEILDNIILSIMLKNNIEDRLFKFITKFSSKTDEKELVNSLLGVYNNLSELGSIKDLDLSKLIIKDNIFNYKKLENDITSVSEEFYEEYSEYFNNIEDYYSYLNGYSETFNEFSTPSRFSWKKLEILDDTKKEILSILAPIKDLVSVLPTKEDINEYFNIELEIIDNIKTILTIYETKLLEFKQSTNKYEFNDIANFLNLILVNNEKILKRQKERFIYVFVDEYQDTSKVQSDFLNMLINNNDSIKVLYVGDLKQSIYKFRNAKPDTFINKQKEVDLISLDTNYRSSSKVIDFVNKIFTNILYDEGLHDINYKDGHIMLSGNSSFNSDNNADVYLLEMFKEEDSKIKNDSVEEAFVIGNKIKELLKEDKINKYSDVAILARNKNSFKIYEDVFKYLNIPIQIQVDQNLKQTYLLKLVANILKLALYINNNDLKYYNDKRFYYFSIVRSELFNYDDFKILNDILNIEELEKNRTLKINNEVYNKLVIVHKYILTKSNFDIIDIVIKEFNVYDSIISTKKQEEKLYQIEYLYNNASILSDLNIYSTSFVDYIYVLAYDDEVNLGLSILEDKEENSVKVTNIHQSKGLEYNTLFITNLNKEFNKGTIKLFNYSSVGGFNFNLGKRLDNTSYIALNNYIKAYRADLIKNDNLKEELRLLYVAFTRAEKALYLVTTPKSDYLRLNSFTDYLYYHEFNSYIKKDNITRYNEYTKDFDYYKHLKNHNKYYDPLIDSLNNVSFDYSSDTSELVKASTSINSLIDYSTYKNIESGIKIHSDFEFNNKENILVKRFYDNKFNNKDLNKAVIINEYQFIYNKDNKEYRGIIDLLAIYDDCIHIIDYKLRDISNDNYIKQLNTYKDYISSVYDKEVFIFLYSITNNEVKEIK